MMKASAYMDKRLCEFVSVTFVPFSPSGTAFSALSMQFVMP